jgi:hypothetical protein
MPSGEIATTGSAEAGAAQAAAPSTSAVQIAFNRGVRRCTDSYCRRIETSLSLSINFPPCVVYALFFFPSLIEQDVEERIASFLNARFYPGLIAVNKGRPTCDCKFRER